MMIKKMSPLLISIMLLTAACAQSTPTPPPTASPTAPPALPTAVLPTAKPVSQGSGAAEGRLLTAAFAWPTVIDPAVGNDNSSSASLVNIYDALVFPNAEGGVDPWLAESWEVSDDGLIWTFHLRQSVKFHDGSELMASDVVYSLERLQMVGEGFSYLFGNVAGASAVDDYTVEFKLTEPSGLFLPILIRLYILNEDMVRANTLATGEYGEQGDYGKTWLLINDAGSGPYQVVDFSLDEYLLMDKHQDWWGDFVENAPDQVRFIAAPDTEILQALMANQELEISDQWQSFEALKTLANLEGVDVTAFPTMSAFYYMVNTRISPTDDVHCRRAMAYAFDYDAAVALEWPGTRQSHGPVPAALGGHNPNVFTFQRDLDKAREELAQCRYADEIDQYPVEVHWISEVPDEEKFALLFQENMGEIGISVKVVSTPWLNAVEYTSAQETSPHIITIYVTADLLEAGVILQQRYHSSTADTWQQNEWLLDPELDAAIEDALATIDQTERFAKYAELQDKIAELAPSIFLYDQVEKHAYQAAYLDWPASREESSAVQGYQIFAAHIGVDK